MKISIVLAILLCFISGVSFSQSSYVVAPSTSSDCQSVYLTDAAGTKMGPYTLQQAQARLSSATANKKGLAELMAQADAQIAASTIAIGALDSCVVPPVLTTNVNWDQVALLASQGVNWPTIKSSMNNVNWPAVGQINGINWQSVNTAGINWSDWFVQEAQGVNYSTWINNGGQ